jgi:adenylate cyclase
LVADILGYSRLAGADEDRTLSRLRGLRSDLIDHAMDTHQSRSRVTRDRSACNSRFE